MEWFIAVLAVAALGVAAMAAAGGMGQMAMDPVQDTYRQDLGDGPLTGEDIRALRFGIALRGYAMGQVDDVLDRLAAEIAVRDAQIAELTGAQPAVRDAHIAELAGAQPAVSSADPGVSGHDEAAFVESDPTEPVESAPSAAVPAASAFSVLSPPARPVEETPAS